MQKEELFKFAEDRNMLINDKVVDRILKRLEITEGHCPCVPENEWTDSHICPCVFCEEEVTKTGHCHCNLFLKNTSNQTAA